MADIREIRVIKPTKNNAKEKLRVAAYCRVSTDSDDQINSFIAQVRYYNDYMLRVDFPPLLCYNTFGTVIV